MSSISGALTAGALAQAGIFTAVVNRISGDDANSYVFAIAGLGLVITAIKAPEGVTGLARSWGNSLARRAPSVVGGSTDTSRPSVAP